MEIYKSEQTVFVCTESLSNLRSVSLFCFIAFSTLLLQFTLLFYKTAVPICLPPIWSFVISYSAKSTLIIITLYAVLKCFFCPSLRLSDCLSFNWAFICLPIDAKWGSACMMSLLCYFTLLLLIYTCLSINAFFVGESSGFSDGSLFNFSCSFSVLANALYCWLFFITKIVHNFKLA